MDDEWVSGQQRLPQQVAGDAEPLLELALGGELGSGGQRAVGDAGSEDGKRR